MKIDILNKFVTTFGEKYDIDKRYDLLKKYKQVYMLETKNSNAWFWRE